MLYGDDSRWSPVLYLPGIYERYTERKEEHQVEMHVQREGILSCVYERPLLHVPLRTVLGFLRAAHMEGQSIKKDFRCLVYVTEVHPSVDAVVEMLQQEAAGAVELTLQDATGPSLCPLMERGFLGQVVATLVGCHRDVFFGVTGTSSSIHLTPTVCGALLRKALQEREPVPWLDVCLRVMYKEQMEVIQMLNTQLL